jgi:hypothetical protein
MMRINPPPAGSIVVKTFGYAPNLGWLYQDQNPSPESNVSQRNIPELTFPVRKCRFWRFREGHAPDLSSERKVPRKL